MRAAALLLALAFAVAVRADVCSPNGRFCAAIEFSADDDVRYTCRLVERSGSGPDRLISTFVVSRGTAAPELITDDGRFLVAVGDDGPDGAIAIFRPDGAVVRVPLSDLVTEHDLARWFAATPQWSVRGDVLVASFFASPLTDDSRRVELELDLRNARVGGPPRDRIEPLLPLVRPATTERLSLSWREARCADSAALSFASGGVVPIASDALLALAWETPLEEQPLVARKARIAGTVRAEVLVDEAGDVACVRVSQLAFGISESAERSLLRWKFRRFRNGATVSPVRGFVDLDYRVGRVASLTTP